MDVFFYGRLADRVGRQVSVDIPSDGCSVAELRKLIAKGHPEAGRDILVSRVRACVDDVVAAEAQLIRPGQSVEFFPPVSGG